MLDCASLLGAQGPLAQCLGGFAPRPQQLAMAEAVAAALEASQTLIVEAGTGTGKTYAYLVPALASGRRVVVSTGTRALQDQLFHRDLPLVRRALGSTARVALLKGRANYLCRHRLGLARSAGRLGSREQVAELARIADWAGRTRSGDVAEVTDVPEGSPVWSLVTSTADNCLGTECPEISDCHLAKARRAAQEAELLVVNHHLLFADMALRDEGFGELLPGADAIVLDEAHQLPEIAGVFFSATVSSRQLLDLARDVVAEQGKEAPDMPGLLELADALERAVGAARVGLGAESRRAAWREAGEDAGPAAGALDTALKALGDALDTAAERGKGLERCQERSAVLRERLQAFLGGQDEGAVCWFETYPRGFAFSQTPLDIAGAFRERMGRYPGAWVFTSATLAVNGQFGHFAGRLGLPDGPRLHLDSPFDFARRALLYHPEGMPDPSAPGFGQALIEAAIPVLEASRGRAFLLFTSHRALQFAERALAGRLSYPLLVQGSLPKAELLERFRAAGNAVLLGTASFWEGVDVRGEALSCVIIDRLPFASPGDPVLQARIEALRLRGGNPFGEYQLPQAVIALKQGVGRLIRDVADRGVLMLADPRLLTRSYGQVFLDSLPPMTRTRRLQRVQRFFELEAEAAGDREAEVQA